MAYLTNTLRSLLWMSIVNCVRSVAEYILTRLLVHYAHLAVRKLRSEKVEEQGEDSLFWSSYIPMGYYMYFGLGLR